MSAAFFTRFRNGPSPAWPKDIEALRTLLDTRLAALEVALADPDQYDSLEQLLGDLVRAATEEADATVRQAYLDAQREAQNAIAAARGEAQTAIEAERGAAASLRHDVEQAHATLQAERTGAAALSRDLDAAQLTLDQEQTTSANLRRELDEARAAADAHRRDLDAAQLTLDQEQTTSANLRRELDEARAAADAHRRDLDAAQLTLDQEQTTSASLRRELDDARAGAEALGHDLDTARLRLDQEQITSASLRRELDEARAGAEALGRDLDAARLTLDQEQTTSASLRCELDEARAGAEALGRDLDTARLTPDQEQATSANLRRELDEAQAAAEAERAAAAELRETVARLEQELVGAREDAQTRLSMLTSVQTDLDLALSDAEARAQAAIDERDKLAAGLEAASVEAGQDAHARYERLREATQQQIGALELALSDAEGRARAALDELGLRRGDVKPHRRDSAAKASPASAASRPQPLRQTARYMMSGEIEVQVDGSLAWLIDLSFSGAQILSSATLKPNTVVRLLLPFGDSSIVCKGKIAWAQIDPAKRGGQLRYRAGVSFTAADQAGIKAFLARHVPA